MIRMMYYVSGIIRNIVSIVFKLFNMLTKV